VLTPLLFSWLYPKASNINQVWEKWQNARRKARGLPLLAGESQEKGAASAHQLANHIIIVGFGIMGRLVARAAKITHIPYIVVEMNAATVRHEKAKGEPIIYGDAATPAILEHSTVDKAHAMVITSTAPALIRRIIVAARAFNPGLYIITRTRFVLEFEELSSLGANEVVPEEFETALEIFTRLLRHMSAAENDINRLVQELRNQDYEHLLSPLPEELNRFERYLSDMQFRTLRVEAGSPADGKSLKELYLRPRYNLNVISVQRAERNLGQPTADTVLLHDDLVVLLGRSESLLSAQEVFASTQPRDRE
jgi:CPA2 family monovalent cation:H+ antiporter-2